MVDTAIFKVTREVAIRSGLLNVRYRTADGYFILDSTDLRAVRLKASEFQTGLQGVTRISKEEAKKLIEQNGYSMGDQSIAKYAPRETRLVEEPMTEPQATIEEPVEPVEEPSINTEETVVEEESSPEETQEEESQEEESQPKSRSKK